MQIRKIIILLLCTPYLCLLTCGAASANTIEVAPGGTDPGSGTHEKPFKSIAKALELAGEGDTIVIRGGTYREGDLTLRHGGSPGKPLTIEGAANESVVIKGSKVVAGWRDVGNGLWSVDKWPVNSQQLFVDGQPLQQIGSLSPWHLRKLWANKMTLPPVGRDIGDIRSGTFYYDQEVKTLYCMLSEHADPNKHLMEASASNDLLNGTGKSFVIIRNLTFMHSNGTSSGWKSALLRVSGSGWKVENCTFAYGDFCGVAMEGDKHIVRRCKVINNGDIGIDLSGGDPGVKWSWISYKNRAPQNIVLEDLEITGNNYRHFDVSWAAGGIKMVPSVRAVTVRRCKVANNLGPGIWMDASLGGNVIEDNLVVDNVSGILYEISMPAEGDSFGVSIRNNRIAGNRFGGIYISASRGAIVENNTCYRNNWDIVLHGMPRNDLGQDLVLRDNVVKNNIVDGIMGDIIVYVGKGALSNIVDGNFYADWKREPSQITFGATTDPGYRITHHSLISLSRDHGFEGHGSSGDPLWKDPDTLDFRLGKGSPTKGKGWAEK